jgi:hypothetical protein
MFIDECPSSAVDRDSWTVIDLFWMCHSRVPGMDSMHLERQCFPHEGTVLEQDNWVMWAFGVVETEYYGWDAGQRGERQRQQSQRQALEKMKDRHG